MRFVRAKARHGGGRRRQHHSKAAERGSRRHARGRRSLGAARADGRVIKDYERAHGTDNFLSDDFKACDMKCIEFEMVRFSSEVLGVVTGSPIDDDGEEEPAQDLNDLVARKNFLRMQDWDYNRSVLDEKLRPIDQQLLALDPDTTMDQENIRFLNDQRDGL